MTTAKAPEAGLAAPAPSVRLDPQRRREILHQLFFRRATWRSQLVQYFTLLGLSVVIATAGLLANSIAVVIAAMLVAPLMMPILGVAAAIVMGWPRRQVQQVVLVVASVGVAIGLGFLIPWLFNVPRGLTLPAEVLARSRPGLADLLVALSAGFAGAYILVRREAISALPGVAIAVSLVPPLGACGILLYFWEPHLAGRAFLLFFTNFSVIVLTACGVFLAAGFRPGARAVTHLATAPGVLLAAVLVLIAAMPLVSHTLGEFTKTREHIAATATVEAWAGANVVEIESLRIVDDVVDIVLVLDVPFSAARERSAAFGDLVPASMTVPRLRELLVQRLGREVEVTVRGQLRLVASTATGSTGGRAWLSD